MMQDETVADHGFEPTTDVENEDRSVERAERMTTVGEAIRYRKRAQAAERQVAQLNAQLEQREEEYNATHHRLTTLEQENALTRQLLRAGATDIEVTLLLTQEKLAGNEASEKEMSAAIETVRTERPCLFAGGNTRGAGPGSAGVRPGPMYGREALRRQAEKTMSSNSRKDMQEYLKLRRSIVR